MKKSLIPVLFFALAAFSVFSQTQEDRDAPKRDIFVILDVSGSMENESRFSNVQDYLEREVVNGLLKDGDSFTLVTFGDTAAEQFSRTIASGNDRAALLSDLRNLKPDNDWTDIGTAMERLAEILERRGEDGVRRVILFITDGLNAPPPGSKYRGADLSVDERFKTLGEKISRGSWYLYVIGIGGLTDAQNIANVIPDAVIVTTDSNLAGADINSRVDQLEQEEAQARAAEEEARRLEAERNAGFLGLLRRFAEGLGLSLQALISGFIALILLLVLLIVLLARIFRIREVVITDERETLIKSLPPFGGILLNSPAAILPGLGNENNQVFRLQRSLFGFKIKTLDSQAMANNTPYKKTGIHPLAGVVSLANGRIVRITPR